jgi:hypothetical protein
MNSSLLVLFGLIAVASAAGGAAMNAGKGEWFADLIFIFIRTFIMNFVFFFGLFPAFFADQHVWVVMAFRDVYQNILPLQYLRSDAATF